MRPHFCCSYEQQEIALNCGTMLRECTRYEALTKILLYSDHFYDFFKYVEVSTFDIASDAFATFKVKQRTNSRVPVTQDTRYENKKPQLYWKGIMMPPDS
jgi:hypothetical protein